MPELASWTLIIILFGKSFTGLGGKAVDHVDGFFEGSCAEAAIRINNKLKEMELHGQAFCITKVGRR